MAKNTDINTINSRKYCSDFYTTVPVQESSLSEYVHGIPKAEGEILDPTEIICIEDYGENYENTSDLEYIDPNIMNCDNCNQSNCQSCNRMVVEVDQGRNIVGGGSTRYLNNINTIGGNEHIFLQSTQRGPTSTVEVMPRGMNSYGYVAEQIQIDRPVQQQQQHHPQQVYYSTPQQIPGQNIINPSLNNQPSIDQLNINNQVHQPIINNPQQLNDQPLLQQNHNQQQIIINNLNKQINNQPSPVSTTHHHHYIRTKPTAQAVKQVFQQGGTKRPRINGIHNHVESNIPPPTPNICQNYIEKNPPIRIGQRRPSDSISVLSNDPNFEKSTLNDVQYQQIARNGGGHGQNGHKIQSNHQRIHQQRAQQNIQQRSNKNLNSSYNSNTSSSSSGNQNRHRTQLHQYPNKSEQTMNVHNGDIINITNQKTENTIMINTFGQNTRRKIVTVHSDHLNRDISVPSEFRFSDRSRSDPVVSGLQYQSPHNFQIQSNGNPQVQSAFQSLRNGNQMHTLQPISECEIQQPTIKHQYQEPNNKIDDMIGGLLTDSDDSEEIVKTQEKIEYNSKIREIATKEPGADFQKNYQKTQRVVRNNPWGQMSYKDMITDAILSKAGYKAKLSDIYTFMINEYEYFNKRQDMDGRKQWSNSVRHNLSSHKDMFINEKEDTSKKPFGTKLGGYWSLLPDKLQIALNERTDKKKKAEKEGKKR